MFAKPNPKAVIAALAGCMAAAAICGFAMGYAMFALVNSGNNPFVGG